MNDLNEGWPDASASFVVQHNPPTLLTNPIDSVKSDLRALIRHILLVSPPPAPTPSQSIEAELETRSLSLSDSTATIIAPAPAPAPSTLQSIPIPRPNGTHVPSILAPRPISQFGTTMAAPFTHAGTYLKPTLDVVNPKKWWPDYLMISRSPSRQEMSVPSPTEPKAPGEDSSESASLPTQSDPAEDKPPTPTEHVPSNELPEQNDDDDVTSANEDVARSSPPSIHLPTAPPSEISDDASDADVDQEALEDAMLESEHPHSDMGSEAGLYPSLPPSPPPPPPFSYLTVRMSSKANPSVTEERTVLHVHVSPKQWAPCYPIQGIYLIYGHLSK